MSEDEGFVFFACHVVSGVVWIVWYWQALTCARLGCRTGERSSLFLYPLLCAAVLFAVLRLFASWDVRDSPQYLLFYLVMGAAWVGLGMNFLDLYGLSARDDVIERRNRSAGHALGGGLLGVTLCFAGANIGDGPGWWVVVFSAALSTFAFFLLWRLLDRFTHLADTVTIERDPAAGLRLAGYFTGSGLILGRAVAGDWSSALETVIDFVRAGWPALLLLAAAVALERMFRPTVERPLPSPVTYGLAPLAVYVALAAVFVSQAGPW